MLRKLLGATAAVALPVVAWTTPVHAQTISTQVFDTVIPFTYDRGRNVSVRDRPRPEYDALGIPVGGFSFFPSLGISGGYDDNVYQTQTNTTGDGFVAINPAARIVSNWSRNNVAFDASGNFHRYFDAVQRNENGWTVGASGRLDFDPTKSFTLGARTSRLYESQFAGAAVTNVLSSVPVQATTVNGLLDARMARLRVIAAGDYSIFNYMPVETLTNTILSQDDRDRKIGRAMVHLEYGVTPDTGIFIQGSYTNTDYRTDLLNGQPNRDSDEYRVLAGVSTDISALLRGSIGVGYVKRSYSAAIYNSVSGFSLDGRLEYFPTEMTTVTLAGRREVEDSVITGSSGYWNNGVALRVDHELLRNLLLNIGADYEVDDFRGIDGKATIFRTSGGGDYLINNILRLNTTVGYSRRTSDSSLNGPRLNEFRATVGVSVRR